MNNKATGYEKQLSYMPWGKTIDVAIQWVIDNVPQGNSIVDLMCGAGHVIRKIAEARPDLSLVGVDINCNFIEHARKNCPSAKFQGEDILVWMKQADDSYDVVMCTGALHHLKLDDQTKLLRDMPSILGYHGYFILVDTYMRDYADEIGRKNAAAELGYQYLIATIRAGAPREVIVDALDILCSDVLNLEQKISITNRLATLNRIFFSVENTRTWPSTDETYGEYFTICRK